MCRLSWNTGASNFWNLQGLSGPVMGLVYLYLYILLLFTDMFRVVASATINRPSYKKNTIRNNCILLIIHPVDGHRNNRNMLLKHNNMWLEIFINVRLLVCHENINHSSMHGYGQQSSGCNYFLYIHSTTVFPEKLVICNIRHCATPKTIVIITKITDYKAHYKYSIFTVGRVAQSV